MRRFRPKGGTTRRLRRLLRSARARTGQSCRLYAARPMTGLQEAGVSASVHTGRESHESGSETQSRARAPRPRPRTSARTQCPRPDGVHIRGASRGDRHHRDRNDDVPAHREADPRAGPAHELRLAESAFWRTPSWPTRTRTGGASFPTRFAAGDSAAHIPTATRGATCWSARGWCGRRMPRSCPRRPTTAAPSVVPPGRTNEWIIGSDLTIPTGPSRHFAGTTLWTECRRSQASAFATGMP
jgi:hypothetical protein